MTGKFTLQDHLHGRTIFQRIIPTVNTLSNLLNRLDGISWDVFQLKNWEKPIYHAYRLEQIKPLLINADDEQRRSLIKKHLLKINAHDLGPHPMCIYFVGYYREKTAISNAATFYNFVLKHGVSQKINSASAIWQVGLKDGVYLNLLNADGTIRDWEFFQKWVSSVAASVTKKKARIKDEPLIKEKISPEHAFTYFMELPTEDKHFIGINSFTWSQYVVGGSASIPSSLDTRFYRDGLFAYCGDVSNDDLIVLLAILSWGGMDRKHAQRLLKESGAILDIVNKLRKKIFKDRREAFSYIQAQRSAKLLPGLGIGYFTKLICFLHPELNGYIMDQWVAKSVNILTGAPVVDVTKAGWLTDKNSPDVYEEFCSFIDSLSQKLNISGFEVEEKLFSYGGKNKGRWRKYVVEHF